MAETSTRAPYAAAGEDRPVVVVLGASNLTRGVSTALGTIPAAVGGPADVFAALGHGRGYACPSRVLGRSLPPIASCGLWDALEEIGSAPRHAALTDVGNDLLYGAGVEDVVGALARCLDRLGDLGPRTVITRIPIESIRRIGRARYGLIRALLFPGSGLDHARALALAESLASRLDTLAAEPRGATAVDLPAAWYGLDGIHLRRRWWPAAWRRIIAAWTPGSGPPAAARPSLGRWWRLRRATPERWSLFGRPRSTPQPAARLPDGTRVWMF